MPDGADSDRRIDSIGGATGSKSCGPWCIKLDVAIKGIEDGTWRFWTSANGKSVWVVIAIRNGKKYLKTEADGAEPNVPNRITSWVCRAVSRHGSTLPQSYRR
ncbi:DUF3892 domain-containing protein [Roseobacter sp. HKCCD8198]|uniref:DUF3892 domain-containing protein n=1 Tax=unclassified Roseobacter TaxID=196798 RepID=UPI003460180C